MFYLYFIIGILFIVLIFKVNTGLINYSVILLIEYFGLTYSNLSEPLTFVTIKDTFIRFSGLVGGNLVKKEESHWKDGHCLKFIEYNYSYQNRLDDNYVRK